MADLTLSLASWTALSGSPTMVNVGTQYQQKYSLSTGFNKVNTYCAMNPCECGM